MKNIDIPDAPWVRNPTAYDGSENEEDYEEDFDDEGNDD